MTANKMTASTSNKTTSSIDPFRAIGEISGKFIVPEYQRGYRWTKDDVRRLLADIDSSREDNKNNPERHYILQPIVVRKLTQNGAENLEQWELIDGQQRLTTLYLITLVIKDNNWESYLPSYSLQYKTRKPWQDFRQDVLKNNDSNIDFYHLAQAYNFIEEWLTQKDGLCSKDNAKKLHDYILKQVKVIWYEPLSNSNPSSESSDQEAIALFTRLNVGRIPLTDAELVKALLLTTVRKENPELAIELAVQWDGIERDLRRREIWAFISALDEETTDTRYPTRISFLLDTLADNGNPHSKIRTRYSTFENLRKRIVKNWSNNFWGDLIKQHALIIGWREDPAWHNKIGYLIASGSSQFDKLITGHKGERKSDFEKRLNNMIRDSLKLTPDKIKELSYESDSDKKTLLKLLLLFNVETLTRANQHFPFVEHTNSSWSLEHIHAQHSEGLSKVDQWKKWLEVHADALRALQAGATQDNQRDKLIGEIDTAAKHPETLAGDIFKNLHMAVVKFFGNEEPDHSIGNLALLSIRDNSRLNNAVFEAKRQIIIELDKQGKYVPICTRNVFLKYYAQLGKEQLHFWSDDDKNKYVETITSTIHEYLMDTKLKREGA